MEKLNTRNRKSKSREKRNKAGKKRKKWRRGIDIGTQKFHYSSLYIKMIMGDRPETLTFYNFYSLKRGRFMG
jgi:hypothetical protein